MTHPDHEQALRIAQDLATRDVQSAALARAYLHLRAEAEKLRAVKRAGYAMRFRNEFDGTWCEANDWERFREALAAAGDDDAKTRLD